MARPFSVDEAGTVRIFGLQVRLEWMIDPTTWAWVAASQVYTSQELLDAFRVHGGEHEGDDVALNAEREPR